ncbi:CPBP family intramembrane glutamic endopeptidase [Anianabacter salinae]|uniref:CPBP family intramembrane glutamic endopeptidase n=1 Tax=Anianabacter salinae TaxID=2851023 RepID=UPI00225DE756|nr:CPBP family intramembrane glutamic endopeptidase [Anianabacter salinae]MBV0913320.1 CPBP family intramembrane metalloprotease [Anianabacter salinae]
MIRPAFAAFVAPARAYPQIWRLLVGLLLALAVYLAVIAALFVLLFFGLGQADAGYWIERIGAANTPTATLLLLGTFLGMALGPVVAARALHKRRAGTLIGPGGMAFRDFLVAGGVVGGLLGVSLLIWLQAYTPDPGLDPTLWLRFLPLALLGVLVQTGAEELLFRGYLQQQLAARFASPLMWLVLPSLLFGIVHLDPVGAGDSALLVVGAAALFGLIAADLTAITGSIGAAWGFHFVNNTFAIIVIATKGAIPGLALYLTPYTIADDAVVSRLILGDVAVLLLAWIVLRRILRR